MSSRIKISATIYKDNGQFRVLRGSPQSVQSTFVSSGYSYILYHQVPGAGERIDPISHSIVPATQIAHDLPDLASEGEYVQGTGSSTDYFSVYPDTAIWGINDTTGGDAFGSVPTPSGENQLILSTAGIWHIVFADFGQIPKHHYITVT